VGEGEDLRQFIREMVLRMERFTNAQVRALDGLTAGVERLIREMRQEFLETRAELRDLRAESRAQREALLRILDRLDGGAATA
jgi:hypothetical protein